MIETELNETQKKEFKKCVEFTDKIRRVIAHMEEHFDGDYNYKNLTFDNKFMIVNFVKGNNSGDIKNVQIQIVFELSKLFVTDVDKLFYLVVGTIQNNKNEIRKKELMEHIKAAEIKIEKWYERKKEIISGKATTDLEEQISASEQLIKLYEKNMKEIESNES